MSFDTKKTKIYFRDILKTSEDLSKNIAEQLDKKLKIKMVKVEKVLNLFTFTFYFFSPVNKSKSIEFQITEEKLLFSSIPLISILEREIKNKLKGSING